MEKVFVFLLVVVLVVCLFGDDSSNRNTHERVETMTVLGADVHPSSVRANVRTTRSGSRIRRTHPSTLVSPVHIRRRSPISILRSLVKAEVSSAPLSSSALRRYNLNPPLRRPTSRFQALAQATSGLENDNYENPYAEIGASMFPRVRQAWEQLVKEGLREETSKTLDELQEGKMQKASMQVDARFQRPRPRLLRRLNNLDFTVPWEAKLKMAYWMYMTEDKPSPIAGEGLFAARDIHKGTVLYEITVDDLQQGDDEDDAKLIRVFGGVVNAGTGKTKKRVQEEENLIRYSYLGLMLLMQGNDGAMPETKTLRDSSLDFAKDYMREYVASSIKKANIAVINPPGRDGEAYRLVSNSDGVNKWFPVGSKIVATCDIPKGTELLRHYGAVKWIAMHTKRAKAVFEKARKEAGGALDPKQEEGLANLLSKWKTLASDMASEIEDPYELSTEVLDYEGMTGEPLPGFGFDARGAFTTQTEGDLKKS